MKILIIDRDQLASQLIASRLGDDITVSEVSVKSEAIEKVAEEVFDVVLVDPTPMKDADAIVINLRRAARSYPYIIVMGNEPDPLEIRKMGANNSLATPVNIEELNEKLESAENLQLLMTLLTDTSEDFPSAGGVIAKSAFNQLFLSAMDRAWRYREEAYILSVSIENYNEIKELDGQHHASYGVSKLANHLVKLRRQSDVIGQVRENEYSLLLQRTANEQEAADAVKRFAASLEEMDDFIPEEGNSLKIQVSLTSIPSGTKMFDKTLLKQAS